MTIAASQGLTCNTSLMYGHGANAFACYPGITRARRENHIWLPLDVVESEQTQARLGTARSERERLERAIDAFARFLGQSRPDGMVSDLLYDPPEPAPLPLERDRNAEEARAESEHRLRRAHDTHPADVDVPVQRDQAQEEARREEEPRLTDEQLARLRLMAEERAVPPWRTRAFGDLTDAALNRAIARNDRLAEDSDALARKDEVAARALAEQLERDAAGGQTRGQAYAAEAGLLLDQVDILVVTAHREMDTAANMKVIAEKRTEWLAQLVKAEQRGRITLRLAGTSRKEQQELSRQYTGERAASVQEQHRAENAARDALREAWTLIQGSQFADALGAGQYQPAPADTVAAVDRFAEMRATAARAGHGIDIRDQQRVGR